jgi:hypothetical protein
MIHYSRIFCGPPRQEINFVKSEMVDLGGIEPPYLGCKPSALPLSYRPEQT